MPETSSAIAVVSSHRHDVAPSNLTAQQVGIAAQLPRGEGSEGNGDLDYGSFFEFLMQSGEAYTKIPQERFNTQ